MKQILLSDLIQAAQEHRMAAQSITELRALIRKYRGNMIGMRGPVFYNRVVIESAREIIFAKQRAGEV